MSAYNINQWDKPVFLHRDITSFIDQATLSDGIHKIEIPGKQSIDIWMQGIPLTKIDDCPALLVGLSGAVTNRKEKSAPFFSGLALATEMRLPIISISDPSLALDDEIALSWYAGNQWETVLPQKIAEILDAIGGRLNIPLVIFGGSGAGFAGLLLATTLKADAKVLVWNPQTSISAYHWRPVSKYVSTAFPKQRQLAECAEKITYSDRSKYLYDLLEETGIIHQVFVNEIRNNISLLYLQNRSDIEHVMSHAARFCERSSWYRAGKSSFCTNDGNIAIFFGDWGEGHAYPPRKLLVKSIELLINNKDTNLIVKEIEDKKEETGIKTPFFHWFCGTPISYIKVNATIRNEIVSVECRIDDEAVDTNGLQYAYYLLKDGHKIHSKWYSAEPFAEFNHENPADNLEVIVFAKGVFGEAVPLGKYPVIRQSIA